MLGKSAPPFRLKLPPQDLEVLSFCAPNPKKVKEWVESLPKMKVGESAKLLYTAIQEINRLKVSPSNRFQILEIIREHIHFVCQSLEKHFLNLSVSLPEKEARIAGLAQALQNHLAIGYKAVIAGVLSAKLSRDTQTLMPQALHRAFTENNLVLLRNLQLYYPAPPNYWLEMHTLYSLAEKNKILGKTYVDPILRTVEMSIEDLYKRALLLATAKPNQLRQKQIKMVYDVLPHWTCHAKVHMPGEHSGLFVIDYTQDTPPTYENLLVKPIDLEHTRVFDASEISLHLRDMILRLQENPKARMDFHMPQEKLGNDLIRILIQAWGVRTERAFTRIEEKGTLRLCVGLSATHYFLSGRVEFMQQITGRELSPDPDFNNPFLNLGHHSSRHENRTSESVHGMQIEAKALKENASSVEKAIDQRVKKEGGDDHDRYPRYECEVVNTSPGGFCVIWARDVPPQVKTGEIVGLREQEEEEWGIGVIRWVKHFRNEGIRMGLELISPNAMACGCQAIQKSGSATEYMRSLLLPELPGIGQPPTLITPNVAFHEGLKANLNENCVDSKIQMKKLVTSTPSFCQFEFKVLMAGDGAQLDRMTVKTAAKPLQDDDFDSVWSSL